MLVNTKNLLTKLLSTSLIISTSFAISACCDEKIDEIDSEVFDELADQNTSQKLIDSDGNYYILTDNNDGTETAVFENGKSITFKRNDNNDLEIISAKNEDDSIFEDSASIISGMLIGYFLSKGLSAPSGYYQGNSFKTTEQPRQFSEIEQRNYAKQYEEDAENRRYRRTGSNGIVSNTYTMAASKVSPSSSNVKVNLTKPPSATAKTGFGSVGVRTSAVS